MGRKPNWGRGAGAMLMSLGRSMEDSAERKRRAKEKQGDRAYNLMAQSRRDNATTKRQKEYLAEQNKLQGERDRKRWLRDLSMTHLRNRLASDLIGQRQEGTLEAIDERLENAIELAGYKDSLDETSPDGPVGLDLKSATEAADRMFGKTSSGNNPTGGSAWTHSSLRDDKGKPDMEKMDLRDRAREDAIAAYMSGDLNPNVKLATAQADSIGDQYRYPNMGIEDLLGDALGQDIDAWDSGRQKFVNKKVWPWDREDFISKEQVRVAIREVVKAAEDKGAKVSQIRRALVDELGMSEKDAVSVLTQLEDVKITDPTAEEAARKAVTGG